MDVLEFAIQMEQEGEALFRELAETASDECMHSTLTMLADAELWHANTLQRLQRRAGRDGVAPGDVAAHARNVFQEMRAEGTLPGVDAGRAELCRKAQQIEVRSRTLYEKIAAEASDPAQRELFMQLAGEESEHYKILGAFAAVLSRQDPATWPDTDEMRALAADQP